SEKPKVETVYFGPPQVLSVYTLRHVEDPQRNFWTSPQDTYTMNDGIITGHKFSDQSAAKTVVDLITSPIRAALPSVTTQTSTSIQTGGGKPDQTTKGSSTSVAPPR